MRKATIEQLLADVNSGEVSIDDALDRLRRLPFEEVEEHSKLDHHRELRAGVPEIVYGEGKTADAIASLLGRLAAQRGSALATRVSPEKAASVVAELSEAVYREQARAILVGVEKVPGPPEVAIVSAGTSDAPVAEEVAATLEFLGIPSQRIADVGVAGLPRTIEAARELDEVAAVVVVAGMEGALPGVLAGLSDRPMIAVPTSIGYGVGIGGFVAMMAMLASCSPGVSVVNIDNGFGAAVAAARIVRVARGRHE